jgi:GNAT superfamily N-acetyltransferase
MRTIEILPFDAAEISQAADLFVRSFRQLRGAIPVLPAAMEDPQRVAGMLQNYFDPTSGLIALENGRLAGYLGWFLVNNFRHTPRKGAYVPEWGHACIPQDKAEIYRRLYRAAGECWAAAGCQVHAITILAHDHLGETAWYWHGFGLAVVDAVRPVLPLNTQLSFLADAAQGSPLRVRKATAQDCELLAELDREHWAHYTRSPVFMPQIPGMDADEQLAFLSQPKNSVWLALDGERPAGFMRFDGYDFDGVAITESAGTIQINGAYMRPEYRGQGAGSALLDSALRDYQAAGFTCCAVDFESFNPEATGFWLKYFAPVAYSLMRVPET